ncbi:terpene cyclase [Streptomyces griseocarneus]|nr:terpene cyclase [Streptomyces griseocarneus]
MTGAGPGEIFCPFPRRVNPHLARARRHLSAWARRTGLVTREAAGRRFERADFGRLAAVVYPTADGPRLELTADWIAWLFLVDDQLDDGAVGRTPASARAAVEDMRALLEAPGGGARPDAPPALCSLADLWARTAVGTTPHWRRRFARHLGAYLATTSTWEAGNRAAGVVPDEETYVVNRRHTGAIYVCMDLIDVVERVDVPEAVHDGPGFTAALDAACNVVCWTNDVFSLEKERSLGETHNLVHVVGHHRGLGRAAALAHVRRAISAETAAFLVHERALLRAHPAHTAVLEPYLAGMRSWMRGNLDWSTRTKRYHPSTPADRAGPEEYLEPSLMRDGRPSRR